MNLFLTMLSIAAILIGNGAAAWAQPTAKTSRVGLLTFTAPPPPSTPTPLEQGLRKLGYVEGQNLVIEPRYANGQMNRLPELAMELTRGPLDVIVAQSYPAALAAKQATTTIPIVVMGAGDPVATGLVASFARPCKHSASENPRIWKLRFRR